jgi:hypothetical protein
VIYRAEYKINSGENILKENSDETGRFFSKEMH